MLASSQESTEKNSSTARSPSPLAQQATKRTKVSLKKPTSTFTNRPKEVILIRGRDPACKQTLTFTQQASLSRTLPVLGPDPSPCSSHGSECFTPSSEPVIQMERGRSQESLQDEEEETGRERKKPRRALDG